MKTCTIDEARAAKARAAELFGRLARVAGVGITKVGSGYGLKVNLEAPPDPSAALPSEVDGVPVRVEVIGEIGKRSPV